MSACGTTSILDPTVMQQKCMSDDTTTAPPSSLMRLDPTPFWRLQLHNERPWGITVEDPDNRDFLFAEHILLACFFCTAFTRPVHSLSLECSFFAISSLYDHYLEVGICACLVLSA